MCNFFSCISNGQGKIFYFDWELRKKCISGELDYNPDSHTSIADYFQKDEDRHNKYEYNPLTKKFTIDQINVKDDSENVEKQLLKLDFIKIVPSLKIKEIYNPLSLPQNEVTPEIIELLQQWDSVWDSVRASVGDSVRASVWAFVGASVWDSVGASVGAYSASFFNITSWKYVGHLGPNPWEPMQKLWELGFVPSFDGKTWRLHSGKKAEIVYEWTPNK